MKKVIYIFIPVVVCLLFFGYGIYASQTILEAYNQCRQDESEKVGAESVAIILQICGVRHMSELSEEKQSMCRAKAANSIEMVTLKENHEAGLNECREKADERSSEVFIKYPLIILKKVGIIL